MEQGTEVSFTAAKAFQQAWTQCCTVELPDPWLNGLYTPCLHHTSPAPWGKFSPTEGKQHSSIEWTWAFPSNKGWSWSKLKIDRYGCLTQSTKLGTIWVLGFAMAWEELQFESRTKQMKSNAWDKLNTSGRMTCTEVFRYLQGFLCPSPPYSPGAAMCSVKMKADIQAPTFQTAV